MPKDKDLKRKVRTRMSKTGESYTAARARLVAPKTPVAPPMAHSDDFASLAGMSDAAVKTKTDRTWKQWVKLLDLAGAQSLSHRDIARHLTENYDISFWWAQSVTVAYERIRGLRAKGQRRDGSYDVNKSKTFPVPIAQLYGAFSARVRRRWLGEVELKIKTARVQKSLRVSWSDGTPVEIYFWSKGAQKSQVQIQHRGLASPAAAESVRADWTQRLAQLGEFLSD